MIERASRTQDNHIGTWYQEPRYGMQMTTLLR